jgi:hypothetical protein
LRDAVAFCAANDPEIGENSPQFGGAPPRARELQNGPAMTNWKPLLLSSALLAGACASSQKEPDGPAERAGEKVDEAAEDTKEAAEEAGDKVEEKTDEAVEKDDNK